MNPRKFITSTIDRLLNTVCVRDADALVFRAGHAPHIYISGKPMPVADYYLDMNEEDVWVAARGLLPERLLEELEVTSRTSTAFDYGNVARFEIEAEISRDGLRLNIWRRGTPQKS